MRHPVLRRSRPLLLHVSHPAIPTHKHNLLIIRVHLFRRAVHILIAAIVSLSLLLLGLSPLPLVGHVLPHRLLERLDPRPNDRTALGRLSQVARHLPYPKAGCAAGLQLLLLASGLQLGRLVLDALTDAVVPELGELVGDSVDGMRGVDFPVDGLGRLDVGDVHEAICIGFIISNLCLRCLETWALAGAVA